MQESYWEEADQHHVRQWATQEARLGCRNPIGRRLTSDQHHVRQWATEEAR